MVRLASWCMALLSMMVSISLQGNPANAADQPPKYLFVNIGGSSVICTDEMTNVCTAPESCSSLGQPSFDLGDNFKSGGATAKNGTYTIIGGYTITFPVACNITCVGNCSCPNCTKVEKITSASSAGSYVFICTGTVSAIAFTIFAITIAWFV